VTGFTWPPVNGVRPQWTGRGFLLGDRVCPILDYDASESGWNEDLTLFHEVVAREGLHPIDVASRRRARRALKKYIRTPPESTTLLEVGCSSGFLLRELIEDWPDSLVIGADFISGPLFRLAEQTVTLPLARFDLVKCPLPSESVDAVVLLNVLEHIEDHRGATAQVARVLKRGGVAVIEVPAGPHLFDAYDAYLQHFRRYRLDELCDIVEASGLRIVERSHLGFVVYPAFALAKRRNQGALNAADHQQRRLVEENVTTSATRILGWALAVEEQLARWVHYPVGIRCVITAIRP
jgi:SAM-dependent methyltransferase